MRAKIITRRQALAIGLGAMVAGKVAGAPVPKDDANKSWVGKTVMPKRFAAQGSYRPVGADPDAREALAILDGASFAVKGEKGTRIELFISTGIACWIEKEQVVPLTEAVEFFTNALKANEKDTFALTSRGWANYLLGKPDKAIVDFDSFLKLTPAGMATPAGTPARWEGLVNRGLVFAEQGEFEKALKDLDEVVKNWPGVGLANVNRGYTYELMGEYAKAIEDYAGVSFPLGLNNMAWLKSTCPDAKFRDANEALSLAKRACDATQNREGMFLDTLAAAYAEAGKFAEAVKMQEKALEDKSFTARYGEEAEKRLQLYKAKKPYRTEPIKKN
jgi:tetratricopeptide (TPR) repeat protein